MVERGKGLGFGGCGVHPEILPPQQWESVVLINNYNDPLSGRLFNQGKEGKLWNIPVGTGSYILSFNPKPDVRFEDNLQKPYFIPSQYLVVV
ncbi:hypothetical protein A2767_07245 [Candidatus Roizmanbacteria bacterium RIFCSPHIGHO2_01_FULL_35_10]|uniref:Uncharacterized protein n=1 Tax=Candidatus Roizmanbacteria bacterium RIFCSPLOWO2_01_FULL_35_13 TaxID=1802055 RepID=A0A1F7I899_9BACT|nr:MAG: hypothetical protein A2767_07245 [Candidatus Roizmanbacteria bacterium RIFCSPHIGHO2_01_FULL_35_10]OGK39512.1 MAG: hypothetical protein A3A74_00635 [Candidatus Roizmanbacteria bacterium RIFCSPLOWO2_01_FULL_35_13]